MTRKSVAILAVVIMLTVFACNASAVEYKKGQKVMVEWKGKWYDSTILEVGTGDKAGKFKIHYDGWSDSWDEWVGTDRMKPKK